MDTPPHTPPSHPRGTALPRGCQWDQTFQTISITFFCDVGHPRSGCQHCHFRLRYSSWFVGVHILAVSSHVGERERKLWSLLLLLIKTVIPSWGVPPSTKPNHLPKAPLRMPPYRELRFCPMNPGLTLTFSPQHWDDLELHSVSQVNPGNRGQSLSGFLPASRSTRSGGSLRKLCFPLTLESHSSLRGQSREPWRRGDIIKVDVTQTKSQNGTDFAQRAEPCPSTPQNHHEWAGLVSPASPPAASEGAVGDSSWILVGQRKSPSESKRREKPVSLFKSYFQSETTIPPRAGQRL